MSQYNLNDNVQDSFSFVLGGFTYQMRYPTVEETESVQEALKKAEEQKDTEEVMGLMYQFISSEDKEAPAIAEAMKKQNIKVIQNFNAMIKAEFSGE